ncbi:MAG: M24 family metallopeptidase, partial [Lachnospiraceae bacterium]|nr:M24 family metallopeptidase [Lachnospiraceae bacterium]
SFKTICAYAEDSAVVHYIAKKDSAKEIRPEGFLLVDSGGHYRFEGTTDITRTISLGVPTDEERKVYTTVLKGNLRLMDTVFPEGFKGCLLDGIAEEALWEEGYFCGHGIGHGVGCYLSVHESEARISRSEGSREVAFRPGVIVSDEPGVYIEGRFGVRLENLLLVEKAGQIDGHRMCRFSPLTLVPFDRESIDLKLLSDKEKDILYGYNQNILDNIGPMLDDGTLAWLKENIDIK